MLKGAALFLLASAVASLLAGALAFVSGIAWWGVCFLYEQSQSPGWCDYLGFYAYLLWLAVFSLVYWATLRLERSLDVQ